ncbi:hypothetical protein KH5H1_27590 [Corallococcus caeni]|nr:hypothetical protein KH5H1_27590 [Corallococcus sp. KH5-1]
MKFLSAVVALSSLFVMACGGPEAMPESPAVGSAEQAVLTAGDSLIGSWQNGSWVQTIYVSGDGYMTSVASGYPCWSVGSKSFRDLVKTSTNEYTGECGICDGTSVVWVPVSITVSTDGLWMTEYFNGTSSSWYKT